MSHYTQRVTALGRNLSIATGEPIYTESSHEYGLVKFQAIARRAD